MKKKMNYQERTNSQPLQEEASEDGLALLVMDLGRAMKNLLRETLVSLEEHLWLIQTLLAESSRKQRSLQPVLLEAQRKGEKHHEERNLRTNKLIN